MIDVIAVSITENDELELTLTKNVGASESVFELVTKDGPILDNIDFVDQTDLTVVIPLSALNVDLSSLNFTDLKLDLISKTGSSTSPVTSINLFNRLS